MKTLFEMNYDTNLVTEIVREECQWAINGEGKATVKIDGTAAIFLNGKLHKRFDRKLRKKFSLKNKRLGGKLAIEDHMFKDLPLGAIACQLPDPITFHQPFWVEVTDSPEDRWFQEALSLHPVLIEGATYELIGEKVQNNIYNIKGHKLVPHGAEEINDILLTYDGIKKWLFNNYVEGIVFHHPDGRMCKIRRKDMFVFKNSSNDRLNDWTSVIEGYPS